jgi:hypothetical protein
VAARFTFPLTFGRCAQSVRLGVWHTTQYCTRFRMVPCSRMRSWHRSHFSCATTTRRGTAASGTPAVKLPVAVST